MKFPYKLDDLTWIDNEHSRNEENVYCYCGGPYTEDKPMTHCDSCRQLFHAACITCLPKPLLYGDNFLTFRCSICTQDAEEYHRHNMSWVAVVHLVIYNLMVRQDLRDKNKPDDRKGQKYFRWKDDICAFIDEYWDYLVPGKKRSVTWNNTIASVLSTHGTVFKSGYEIFHQSAWWSLHEQVPPSKDKPRTTKVKAPGKPTQKRARPDDDPKKQANKPKKIKVEKKEEHVEPLPKSHKKGRRKKQKSGHDAEVPSKEDDEMFDMSSLSELSSDEEMLSRDDHTNVPKRVSKSPRIVDSASASVTASSPTPALVREPEQKLKTMPSHVPSMDDHESSNATVPHHNIEQHFATTTTTTTTLSNSTSADTVTAVTATAPAVVESTLPENVDNTQDITAEVTSTPTTDAPLKPARSAFLTQQEEWQLLQRLDNTSKHLPPAALRYQRKLAVRRLKRNLGLKLFDLDAYVTRQIRSRSELVPLSKQLSVEKYPGDHAQKENEEMLQLSKEFEKITYTPYNCSFARRLYGSIRQESAVTRDEPWLSSWNGRKLRPFIRRDFQSRPPMMRILHEIEACAGKPMRQPLSSESSKDYTASIDYVYFQPQHLDQANTLLRRSFWEGIDVSESLLFPEFSIVALYKQAVIGCAFMTPEAYITYFAVSPGWDGAGIGQFMLYHLFQTAISKDITLHVSANNSAMILYQKFGFKPEEFIVDFYDKYLPSDSVYSKNAFFLRLRR